MNIDKLPTVATAMARAEEKHRGNRNRRQRYAYIDGFTDAIALVKAMLRDEALDEVARIGQEIDAMPDREATK